MVLNQIFIQKILISNRGVGKMKQNIYNVYRALAVQIKGGKSNGVEKFHTQNSSYWILIGLFFFFLGLSFIWEEAKVPSTNESVSTSAHLVSPAPIDGTFKGQLAIIKNFEQLQSLPEFWRQPLSVLDSIPSASPLEKNAFVLSSSYGWRQHPIKNIKTLHHGIDMASQLGTPVFSTASGTVVQVENKPKGYGHYIVIAHSFGFETLYGHLSESVVQIGDTIVAQQLIGLSGNTGRSTGPHLHYEVLKNKKTIDPIPSFGIKYKMYDQRLNGAFNQIETD